MTTESSVYFLQAAEEGLIKIGFTTGRPSWRMTHIQTKERQKLTLLASMRGTREDEEALHARFANSRVRGEWFEPTDELVAFCLSMAASGNAIPAEELPSITPLKIPAKLRSDLYQIAEKNGRGLSAQILFVLERSVQKELASSRK